MHIKYLVIFLIILGLGFPTMIFAKPAVLLMPVITANPESTQSIARPSSEKDTLHEINILSALFDSNNNEPLPMDVPQLFRAVCFPKEPLSGEESLQMDLLGDLEEIRYRDKKAWNINFEFKEPALCHFIMEAKPVWIEEEKKFKQDVVKVIVSFQFAEGWNKATGLPLEILPYTMPFDLVAPCLFSGRVAIDGKATENVKIQMFHLDPKGDPRLSGERLEAITDVNGQFAFMLNYPGWWCCEAVTASAPMKAEDGEMREAERAAILWIYVHPSIKK